MNRNHGSSVGIWKTFPRIGSPNGPGGIRRRSEYHLIEEMIAHPRVNVKSRRGVEIVGHSEPIVSVKFGGKKSERGQRVFQTRTYLGTSN